MWIWLPAESPLPPGGILPGGMWPSELPHAPGQRVPGYWLEPLRR